MLRNLKLPFIIFLLFFSYRAGAQDSLKFMPGSPYYSEFCVIFRQLAKMGPDEMAAIGEKPISNDPSVWVVPDKYTFPGARFGMVHTKSPVSYRTVLMVRDKKEQLKSSYNNLVHQVQDCLVEEALIKEKKLLNKELYTTTIIPGMPEEMPFGVEVEISIEFNLRTMKNELLLIIKPSSKGY